MTQRRQTKTNLKIKEAFTYLMNKKGLEAMSVSDLTRQAKINRSTFYHHYTDKYDLKDHLEQEAINDLKRLLLDDSDNSHENRLFPYPCILNALNYVKEDLPFFLAMTLHNDSRFSDRFKEVLKEMIAMQVSRDNQLNYHTPDIPEDYATEIMLGSVNAIILLWLRKGGIDTPNAIATLISQAKYLSPYQMIGQGDPDESDLIPV